MTSRPRRRAPSRRSVGAVLILVALAMSSLGGVVKAATPVEVGFRDFVYGNGANHTTADKPQSKLWFADGSWYGGLFNATDQAYRIYRFDTGTNDWTTGAGRPILDPRNDSHGDYLFANNTLWVASAHPTDATAPHTVDTIRVYRSAFNPATDTYATATWATIPNTQTVSTAGEGGTPTVTIARDATSGRLMTAWPHGTQVRYSISLDNGDTWSAPAQVPGQVGNPIAYPGNVQSMDIASVVSFGNRFGILWSDHDNLPDSASNGFYFTSILASDDPTVPGNWSPNEKLPSPVGANDGERADNHINMKVAEDGTIYAVTKTGKDTANCATEQSSPLIVLYRRTPAAVWSPHLVATVGDCGTRPQVALSDQLDVVYVALTSPNGGGSINLRSAPMTGPEALKFRTADTTIQPGIPFIKSATETQIDDASMGKQAVTSASGLLVLANNVTSNNRAYLHNRLTLGGAPDGTDPVGTITIDGGAASTSAPSRVVSLAVPATDAGSGVSQVRIANAGGVDGSGILNGAGATTFAYTTPKSWTLPAGDGLKTVYAQWRDGAGNWSPVSSDTIIYDSVALVGNVTINDDAAFATAAAVTLNVTATDAGSGVDNVRIANVGTVGVDGLLNGAGATNRTYAASQAWTLTPGNGTKTVYVQWQDGNGVWSPVDSDTIVLDATDPVGTLLIDDGAASTSSPTRAVSLSVAATDEGSSVTKVRIANDGSTDGDGVLDGAGATTRDYATPQAWTLSSGDGIKTVYVQWQDAAGNWSAVASDTIFYDVVATVGNVSINSGAAFATTTAVSLDVTATDAGSGVDNVRIANVGTLGSDGLLNGAGASTRAYAASQPWTLSTGDGTKTVYVQWQDGAGVWSPVKTDTIVLDTTAPTGTVSINGGANRSTSSNVSVAVAATDSGTGVTQVRMANSAGTDGNGVLNGAGATTSAYSTPKTWTLASGTGTRTVFVQWRDGAGHWSAVVSDSITIGSATSPFTDIDGSTFYDDIVWLADSGITKGCSPTKFCPNDRVTRGQMAAFLHRALPDLPLGKGKTFIDDNGSTFEKDIEWLSAAGITQGCSPDRFCPNAPVTRAQMAAFLHRALPDLPLGTPRTFTDTAGTFQADIAWLSAAGITQGCSPTKFCPNDPVTRGQMAAFLHRALGD